MHRVFFTLSALLTLATVHAVPAGQPSNVPSCVYTCPPRDGNGFPLGTHNDDGVTMFCSYPARQGEDPNDFYCNFSHGTGVLMLDNDVGLCAGNAVANSCPGNSQRRSPIPRAAAPPMAAPVARAPIPNEMKVRSQLKKRRPVQIEA